MTLISNLPIRSRSFEEKENLEDKLSECCDSMEYRETQYRRNRPPIQIDFPSCNDQTQDTPIMEDLKLYILVEEANGLYFVDGDQPRACVAIECGNEQVCNKSLHYFLPIGLLKISALK